MIDGKNNILGIQSPFRDIILLRIQQRWKRIPQNLNDVFRLSRR